MTVETIADVIDRWYAVPGYSGAGLYGGKWSMDNTAGLPVSSQTWNLKLTGVRWTANVPPSPGPVPCRAGPGRRR